MEREMPSARNNWLVKSGLARKRRQFDSEKVQMVKTVLLGIVSRLTVTVDNLEQQVSALERKSVKDG